MDEEDADEREADSAEVQPTTITPNFGRKTEANEEPSQEGGVSTLARVVKMQPNGGIADVEISSSTSLI